MSTLQIRFREAAAKARALTKRPRDETLLKLYALYKQATVGDVQGKRPGPASLVDRLKYDAWSQLEGLDQETAMADYIRLVTQLTE